MNDSRAPETRDCKYCDEPEGEPHRGGCPASLSDPPVGKDSSFEKLLERFEKAAQDKDACQPWTKHCVHSAEYTAARAALSRYVEQLKAFSRTAYLSANRDLEAKLAASYLAIERRDAQIASLQSEIERQREEIERTQGECSGWRGQSLEDLRLALDAKRELERQRETTLTPAEARMIDDALDGTNGQVWAQVVAKLRRIASSSPLTRDKGK